MVAAFAVTLAEAARHVGSTEAAPSLSADSTETSALLGEAPSQQVSDAESRSVVQLLRARVSESADVRSAVPALAVLAQVAPSRDREFRSQPGGEDLAVDFAATRTEPDHKPVRPTDHVHFEFRRSR